MSNISAQLQTGLQAFLQQSIKQMFNRIAPPASSIPHIVSITPVSALPQAAKTEEPMDSAPSQPPLEIKKGILGVKGSSAIALKSIQAVASNIMVPTSALSSQAAQQPAVAPPPRLQSPLQAADTSASSFVATRSEEPSDTWEQATPPNLPFRELVQKAREFLAIPDPAAEEDYKLGSALEREPLLLQQEKANRLPSIKLPMVADLSHLQSAQDDLVKSSTSSTLDIGKFPGIPQHKGRWYSVVDTKYSQTPQVVPQAFSNIANPGYRSGPPATVKKKPCQAGKFVS